MNRLIFMIEEIYEKLKKDRIADYASQSCFYILLSFVPCLLLLMSLVKFLPITQNNLFNIISGVIPAKLSPLLEGIFSDLYESSSFTLTSITAIGALWASGKGFLTIMRGFDQIYETQKKRNWLLQRIMSSVYAMFFIITIIATLLLMVFGNTLFNYSINIIPNVGNWLKAILSNRILLFPSILTLLFTLMYIFIPYRKTSFLAQIPGAFIAAIGWYGFSFLYSLYVDNSPNFSYMYGSLTTFIFALIWMYACMNILFIGAEINSLISKKIINKFNTTRH